MSEHPMDDPKTLTKEQKEYYSGECVFCLEVVEPPYPDLCPGCKVVRCTNCQSFIPARHGKPDFCHGCGTVMPEVEAHFTRVSSTGCVYMEGDWMRRNKGHGSDGDYSLGTGHVYKKEDGSVDMERWGIAVSRRVKEDERFKHEDVRILTDEEVEALKKFREKHNMGRPTD